MIVAVVSYSETMDCRLPRLTNQYQVTTKPYNNDIQQPKQVAENVGGAT